MNRVLVTDVGRSPALNFCRSLRISDEDFFIVGIDSNKYSLTWAESDVKILVPDCNYEKYIDIINKIVDKYQIDFIYPSKTGRQLILLSDNREKLHAKMCLPLKEDIELFEDKWKTYELLSYKNICKLPKSFMVHNENDLFANMKELSENFTKEIWLRRVYGSGGACAIPTSDYDLAKCWINRYNGWGKFMISTKLTQKTLTWSGIWDNGKLIVSLIRERLYWEFADRSPAGVTGITGAQKVIKNPHIHDISINIVRNVSKNPHGVICIDYTLDEDGNPNLTEIQASRLYTSSFFMAKCGLNLPCILYKVGMGLPISEKEVTDNSISEGKIWLKYVETFPGFVDEADLINSERERDALIEEVSKNE